MAETKIDLTTDFTPGDDYSDGPYTHAKFMRVLRDDASTKTLIFEWCYGKVPSADFEESTYASRTHTVSSTSYDTYAALVTNGGETIGDAIERCCNQTLLDMSVVVGAIA